MMMHKSFLCLLKHPVMSHLRNLTIASEKSSSTVKWNVTTIPIALILLLYAGSEGHEQSIDHYGKFTSRLLSPLGEFLLPVMDYLGHPCFANENSSQRPSFEPKC
jgi:hypothetical protein